MNPTLFPLPPFFAPCDATRHSILFDSSEHGTLLVTNMFDIDNEETDDITLAMRVVCPLPNGEWINSCTCPNCGRLREIKSGKQ